MVQMKDDTTDKPAGELAPAPIQGSGPGWEDNHISDRVVEARAMAGCQESSAELSDERAKRLPPGAEASRDPTSIIEVLHGSLESQGGSSVSAKSNSTGLVDQCCIGAFQTAGGKGGITETVCMADVDDLTAAAQPAEERAATSCGDLKHTNGHDIKQNINPDHATSTPEKNSGQGGLDGFRELLQAAMRQSDAERAQDRESARNFRRVRQPSPLEQQQGSGGQPIISPPPETQPPATTSSSASDPSGAECIPAGPVRIENAVTASCSSSSTLPPTPQLRVAMPVVVERQWVRYLSPEGYPYLYDEVTGESEWVVWGEEEAQSGQNKEPTRDTTSGAMHAEPGNAGHVVGQRDGHNGLLETACITTRQRSTSEYPAEAESAGTYELSQWSQDTSGPDARNSAGETAMHLAAAQRSLRGISLLLANGASANARDHRGRTPLHAACASCHEQSRGTGVSDLALLGCIDLLLSSGALEDARDENGQTALHLSALAGNLGAARALLAGGATTVADDAGNSPLHLAAAQGHSDIIHLLVVENRGEPSQEPPASISPVGETRAQRQPPAAFGELQSVFDVDLSAHEGGPGTAPVSVGRQESVSTTTSGAAFGGDDGAARITTPPFQNFGARDSHSKVLEEPTEDDISSREQHSHYGEPGIWGLKDETPASVDNGPGWGGSSPLSSLPNDQTYPRGQRGVHENIRSRWQAQADYHNGLIASSMRTAGSTSEDDADGGRGHHAVGAEHRRRGARGSRLSRRRHESARDESTLSWPEALPSNEYEQVVGAAFAGDGCSVGNRAPTRSALSAALFAACLASQPSDVAALLHLLNMHGDGGGGDVRDENGRTPLHHVCRADDVGVVRLLCQAGADAAAQDCQGNSPLMVAAATGGLACLQLLVQQGSDLNCSNDDGDTPLHVAVRHGNLSCVKTLVEGGAWLRQRNTQGFTPREDLLNTKPMFTRGRLPKVLRATLEYVEHAEASEAQPSSPTWTARDGHGSEAAAVSAISRQSLTDNHHHHHHHHHHRRRRDSRREGNRLTAASGRVLPGQRRPAKGSTSTSITDRRDREQHWEPRGLQGAGDGFDGQSEGGISSSGRSRREQAERSANTYTESEPREDSEEEPPVDSRDPSKLREGVWSVVGRAIDSLIGGGNGGISDGPAAESDDSEQEKFENRRPPTDAELRARMRAVRSPPSVSGSRHTPESVAFVRATGPSQPCASSDDPKGEAAPPTTEHVAVKVPISLTPMQPPPDVLAVMKGRAALGCRRPRFPTPPDDVTAALEKTREAKNHGHGLGGAHGKDGNSGARNISYPDGRKEKPRSQQQHEDKGVKQELGPFSLSASGGLGKQGHRPARSMYIDYFDERKRMHEAGGGDV